ncbi:hypothetical protein F5Y16DRAFT_405091 [Xylariaceae sp. FL0255]|nr:hypothetical protein F5Y16DRAFT_405091 [Xylariaceae sp. FL0255]
MTHLNLAVIFISSLSLARASPVLVPIATNLTQEYNQLVEVMNNMASLVNTAGPVGRNFFTDANNAVALAQDVNINVNLLGQKYSGTDVFNTTSEAKVEDDLEKLISQLEVIANSNRDSISSAGFQQAADSLCLNLFVDIQDIVEAVDRLEGTTLSPEKPDNCNI